MGLGSVCVCVPSRCVPSIKLRGGGQKVWVFFVCVVSHLIFFLGVPSNGINRVVQSGKGIVYKR